MTKFRVIHENVDAMVVEQDYDGMKLAVVSGDRTDVYTLTHDVLDEVDFLLRDRV